MKRMKTVGPVGKALRAENKNSLSGHVAPLK